MKLTARGLFDASVGAVRYTQDEKGVQLLRFREEEKSQVF